MCSKPDLGTRVRACPLRIFLYIDEKKCIRNLIQKGQGRTHTFEYLIRKHEFDTQRSLHFCKIHNIDRSNREYTFNHSSYCAHTFEYASKRDFGHTRTSLHSANNIYLYINAHIQTYLELTHKMSIQYQIRFCSKGMSGYFTKIKLFIVFCIFAYFEQC